ncbi:uncharacterized protein LOC117340483 [Pecten maximus]|uniref:uncharacterized protein LOC117340483 n=1 Tax=Pecten maximus TaxID=6579 RepID=UPI0014588202|nr:uncharacterized protein LOC117340483 [Pecten maximus]
MSAENSASLDDGFQEVNPKNKKASGTTRAPSTRKSKQPVIDFSQTSKRSSLSGPTQELGEKLDRVCAFLKDIVTAEMLDNKLDIIKEEIMCQNKEIFHELENRINSLERENRILKNRVGELEEKVDEIEQSPETEPETNRDLEIKYNDLEQQGRKNSIRIYGLQDDGTKETTQECTDKVVSLIKDKLKLPTFNEAEIDVAHRLGKHISGKTRSVICKFVQRRKKSEVVTKRRALKGSGIVIVEDMTQMNRTLLNEVKQVEGVKNTWCSDGKLFAMLSNDKIVRIDHYTVFENLTNESKKKYKKSA